MRACMRAFEYWESVFQSSCPSPGGAFQAVRQSNLYEQLRRTSAGRRLGPNRLSKETATTVAIHDRPSGFQPGNKGRVNKGPCKNDFLVIIGWLFWTV